jgi:hypothetical protein
MPERNRVPTKPPAERRCPTPPPKDSFSEDEQAQYEGVMERRRRGYVPVHRYYDALLNSPALAYLISEGGKTFRAAGMRKGTYSHADREWIDQVLAVELHDNRIVGHHLLDAVAVGVRPQAVRALRQGRDDDLTPDELELARYIRQVIRGTVTDESYRAIVDRFGVRGAVDFTAFVAWLVMTDRNEQAFDAWYDGIMPRDHPMDATTDEEIDQLIQRFIDGKVELPDQKTAVGL